MGAVFIRSGADRHIGERTRGSPPLQEMRRTRGRREPVRRRPKQEKKEKKKYFPLSSSPSPPPPTSRPRARHPRRDDLVCSIHIIGRAVCGSSAGGGSTGQVRRRRALFLRLLVGRRVAGTVYLDLEKLLYRLPAYRAAVRLEPQDLGALAAHALQPPQRKI